MEEDKTGGALDILKQDMSGRSSAASGSAADKYLARKSQENKQFYG